MVKRECVVCGILFFVEGRANGRCYCSLRCRKMKHLKKSAPTLRGFLLKLGMTPQELAFEMEVNVASVYAWLNESRHPTFINAFRLAEIFRQRGFLTNFNDFLR